MTDKRVPREPTVAESHQRIVRGEGTPEDYLRVVGDPRQSVGMSCEAPAAPDERDGQIARLNGLIEKQIEELVDSRAERDALKAALRRMALTTWYYQTDAGRSNARGGTCRLCGETWTEAERHAENCLAAPEDAP